MCHIAQSTSYHTNNTISSHQALRKQQHLGCAMVAKPPDIGERVGLEERVADVNHQDQRLDRRPEAANQAQVRRRAHQSACDQKKNGVWVNYSTKNASCDLGEVVPAPVNAGETVKIKPKPRIPRDLQLPLILQLLEPVPKLLRWGDANVCTCLQRMYTMTKQLIHPRPPRSLET